MNIKIVVVDDERDNLDLVYRTLRQDNYDIVLFDEPDKAIDYIRNNKDIGIIIADERMPDINGTALLKIAREEVPDAIRIIITGYANIDNAIDAINKGKVYGYIRKPFDISEFRIFIKQAVDRYRLVIENKVLIKELKEKNKELIKKEEELRKINLHLESIIDKRTRELLEKNAILNREFELAREVQTNILPQNINIKEIDCSISYFPIFSVGGDFYDIYKIDENRIGILIADVTGHGVSAALNTMILKSSLEISKPKYTSPAAFLERLNNEIIKIFPQNSYLTAFFMEVDLKNKNIKYSSGGHPPQFILRNGKVINLKTKGTILGMFEGMGFYENSESFRQGDIFLLFTDGIFEVFNENGDALDIEGFEDIVKANYTIDVELLNKRIIEGVNRFSSDDDGIQDDITLISLKVSN